MTRPSTKAWGCRRAPHSKPRPPYVNPRDLGCMAPPGFRLPAETPWQVLLIEVLLPIEGTEVLRRPSWVRRFLSVAPPQRQQPRVVHARSVLAVRTTPHRIISGRRLLHGPPTATDRDATNAYRAA